MPEAEVNRRIAVIKDGMSKGRLQGDVADELDWSAASLNAFMKKNNMPKWEKRSAAALTVIADLKENGQNNRTQKDVAEQACIDQKTLRAAVKRMKHDTNFTWVQGGVNQKTVTAREIFDGAIKDGTVRASRRSPGRRMLSAAESCSRIRTPASPSPLVFVDSSLGCSSWTIGRIVNL